VGRSRVAAESFAEVGTAPSVRRRQVVNEGMQEIRSPFVRSILERSVPSLQTWRDAALDAHRGPTLRGAIDALAANVPSLHRLLGSDTFDEVAAAFVRAQLPRGGSLCCAAGLPEFLSSYRPLIEHDYLPGVAALDLAWIESHLAAEADVLTTEDVFALTAEQLLHGRLVPHPATRWLTFAVPSFTIWRRQREERPHGAASRRSSSARAAASTGARSTSAKPSSSPRAPPVGRATTRSSRCSPAARGSTSRCRCRGCCAPAHSRGSPATLPDSRRRRAAQERMYAQPCCCLRITSTTPDGT
jgi:hypothetical protein